MPFIFLRLMILVCHLLGAPPLLLQQTEESASEMAEAEDYEVTFTSADMPYLIGTGVVFLLIIGGAFYWFFRNYNREADSWGQADAMFERSLLREVSTAPKVPSPPPATAESPQVTAVQSVAVAAATAEPTATVSVQSIDELVSRLQQADVISAREGSIAMPIPPDAPIYRLKSGGFALLLARMESEAFMAHQAKRFDRVYVMTGSGEVLVLSRLG